MGNTETSQVEAQALRERVARMTRINRLMMVAVGVLVVAALATPAWRMAGAATLRSGCYDQQRAVEIEAQAFRATNLDFPNEASELPSGGDVQCPAGGDYVWNPVTGTLECSEHGHWNGDGGPATQE